MKYFNSSKIKFRSMLSSRGTLQFYSGKAEKLGNAVVTVSMMSIETQEYFEFDYSTAAKKC